MQSPAIFTRLLRGWSPRLERTIHLEAAFATLVHNHGLWMLPNVYARRAATGLGRPLVISPRGMLDTWSMRRGRVKKWLAWHLYEQCNLRAATAFHATSSEEAQCIRRLGFRQPIAVIPNGVELPSGLAVDGARPEVRSQMARKRLLFMSRLHPKKGLGELLEAWSRVRLEFPDWELVIVGPDLDGHAKLFQERAQGMTESVRFLGPLFDSDKEEAFHGADLFVLPTHSENFGLVIAEALAHGLPVITTRAAPWQGLEAQRCGWWIETGVEPLVDCLRTALRVSVAELQEMGARGRSYVATCFSWSSVARQMLDFYRWVLGHGAKPEFMFN